MAEPIVYFPEPTTPDRTVGRCKESTFEWLARSTHPRAVALREYLNRSLNYFPHRVAKSLAERLEFWPVTRAPAGRTWRPRSGCGRRSG